MRKRKNELHVFLNEAEYAQLNKLASETGLSKSKIVWYLICGFSPPQAPPADYRKLIRQIRAVGNNLNQILTVAKANGILNVPDLRREILDLRNVEKEIQQVFQVKRYGSS